MAIGDVFSLIKTTSIPNAPTSRLLHFLLPAGVIDSARIKIEGATTSANVVFNLAIDGAAVTTTELTMLSGTNEIEATGLAETVTNDQFATISIDAPFTSGALDGVTSIGVHVTYVTQSVNLTGAQTVAGVKTFSDSPIVPTPTTATQAANKSYVDGLTAGLSWKQAVRVATAAAGTLATDFDNGSTVDGVVIATGDRILIKDQASATENGIYIVVASGAPTRATDADSGAELVNASVYASEGTANADKQFVCTTNAPITIGATNITFTEFSSGSGLALDNLTDVVITAAASGEYIRHNGTNWVDGVIAAGDLPTAIDATKIADGSVTNTEFQYIGGLTSDAQTQITGKQATLVSGTNIKTINSTSLLGAGDIAISGSVAADAIFDAKGDLAAGTGADTAARLPVGTNGQFLKADSTQTTGLIWDTIPGGGDLLSTNNLSDLASAVTALTNLGLTATAAELNALDGITATVTELNYTDGVTSAIQTQLDAKLAATATGIGKQTIYIPASAMIPATTSGPASAQLESTTNDINYSVLDFDATADEHAHFNVAFPKSWNLGTVTFQVYWTTTNTGTEGVAWGLQGIAIPDADAIDTAFGTAVVVTDDAQTAAGDVLVTAESGAVTIGGTPADDDLCFFRIFRDVSDANDDMTQDARLIGVKLFYTTDTGTDA